jgi:CHASE2 domain-containing sensor protein
MADDSIPETVPVPWSARSPQRYVFAALAVIIGIAVVLTALAYIRAGTGGVVPFLMITVGPVLAVVYVYYFGFRKFDQQD